jgi:hypothetical protein
MTVRTLTQGDDPIQVIQDINAAFDGTTATDLNAKKINGFPASQSIVANNVVVRKSDGKIAGDIDGNANGIVETGTGGLTVYKKIINIGDWDMYSTYLKIITHNFGSLWNKVISIQAIIIDDDSITRTPLNFAFESTGLASGNIIINSTTIRLARKDGGIFDSTNYDSTSFNRGWIVIEYTQ